MYNVDDLIKAVRLGYRRGYRRGRLVVEPYDEHLSEAAIVLQDDAAEWELDLSMPLFPGRQLDGGQIAPNREEE